MKIFILFLIIIFSLSFPSFVQAQVPLGLNYQAVARDASGKVLDKQSVSIKITIREGTPAGTNLYEEMQQDTTDTFGLFNLVIGQGSPTNGSFDAIDWGSAPKFLQISIDPEGGDNFIDMGTTQLMSVPYALYAAKSGGTSAAPTLHPGKGIAIANDSLTNTGDTDASDDLTVTTEAKGDVSGKFSALKVERLQDTKLQIPDAIDQGSVLKWDGKQWKPGEDSTVWNNQDSLIFYPKGSVGIGINQPEALLHINRIVAQDDTFIQPMLKLTTLDTTTTSMGEANPTGLSIGLAGNQTFITSNQSGAFILGVDAKEAGILGFSTGGEDRMVIDAAGRVGIGTFEPSSLLHVHDPSNANVSLSQYTNTITGIGNGKGMYVGVNEIEGLIRYEQSGSLLHFEGNDLRLSSRHNIKLESSSSVSGNIILDGNRTGIGVDAPTHELHLLHASTAGGGATAGFKIENKGSNGNWWALYTANGSGQLELYHNGMIKGKFKPDDGAYEQGSDRRLKRNIKPLSAILEKVMQLQPSTYFFKDDENPAFHSLGFIAQEVQPLFPELVGYAGEEQDIMTLNYQGFSVLAIKAIQEQQTEMIHQQRLIDQLQEQVSTLQTQIKELYTLISLQEQVPNNDAP